MTLFRTLILQTFLALPGFAQDPGIRVLPGSADIDPATIAWVDRLQADGVQRLSRFFPGTALSGLSIYLHQDLNSVPQEIRRHLHRGTAGLALLQQNQVHLILEEARLRPPGDLKTVVDHELVHMLLHAHCADAGPFVPRWFHEGLAQELSGATYFGVSEEDIILPARMGQLLRFRDLRSGFPDEEYSLRLAYAQSFSYVSFLTRRYGVGMLVSAATGSDAENWYRAGFLAVAGTPLIRDEVSWLEYLKNESGAFWRRLQNNCFFYLMIPGSVLLAWAAKRAIDRDRRTKLRLEQEELLSQQIASRPEDAGPPDGEER